MARISDWLAAGAKWLRVRREGGAAGVVGMGKILVLPYYMFGGGAGSAITVGIPGLRCETRGTQLGVESGFYA
jgi:hypothetical protein